MILLPGERIVYVPASGWSTRLPSAYGMSCDIRHNCDGRKRGLRSELPDLCPSWEFILSNSGLADKPGLMMYKEETNLSIAHNISDAKTAYQPM